MTSLKQSTIATTIASIMAISCFSVFSTHSYANTQLTLPTIQTDQDHDGVDDQFETLHGFDSTRPYDVWRDLDKDHLPALYENILGSDTKQRDNDLFNNRQLFIVSAVADIQGRFADSDTIDKLQASKLNPLQIYQQLLTSKALKQMDFIARAYELLLQRIPDRDGARYYFHQLSNPQGLSAQDVIAQILNSEEFAQMVDVNDNPQFKQWLQTHIDSQNWQSHLLPLTPQANLNQKTYYITQLLVEQSQLAPNDYYVSDMLVQLLTDKNISDDQISRFSHYLSQQDLAAVLLDILISDDYRQARNSQAVANHIDSDADGRPDSIEFVLGFDSQVKDNDVLGSDKQFLQQISTDLTGRALSPQQLEQMQLELKTAGSRSQFLLSLAPYKNKQANLAWVKKLLLPQGQNSTSSSIESILESSAFQARFY